MLIGLVGAPSSGKSTFFKASTLADVGIASYPFTTIKANEGIGYVKADCPEKEFEKDNTKNNKDNKKCQPNHGFCLNGKRFIPVKLIDVAGLVPEAHKGKGKGNEFLDDLREADLLIHILDTSGKTNEKGEPTEDYDIKKNILFLKKEIDMWIKQILTKNWKNLKRKSKETSLTKEIAEQLSGLKIKEGGVKEIVKKLNLEGKEWQEQDFLKFAKKIRGKSKPMIIAANKFDLEESQKNFEKLKENTSSLIVPCSADFELALREASKQEIIDYIPGSSDFKIKGKQISEKQEKALERIKSFLKNHKSTGVQTCLNKAVFDFLNYIVVYPVENENKWTDSRGNFLPDSILLPSNSTALDLAFAIHTDIGNSFIGAIDAKTKRRLGKESVLNNSDVIKILTKN